MLATIAHVIGAHDPVTVDPWHRPADELHGRSLLLVLDNFEQVIDAAAGTR